MACHRFEALVVLPVQFIRNVEYGRETESTSRLSKPTLQLCKKLYIKVSFRDFNHITQKSKPELVLTYDLNDLLPRYFYSCLVSQRERLLIHMSEQDI